MSFSAQTCLTYTGTTTLGGTFNVYTNNDYSTPLSSVTLTQITTNCPFIFVVPDGTTSIRLVDTLSRCYVDIPVSSNDLCSVCDLNFNYYVSDSIGKISAGLLTGSCSPSITDYIINWYGPNSLTNVSFTSGLGTYFSGYNYTHPLTGITSVPSLEGDYTPIIDRVRINGINYSSTGGSGNVLANLSCFLPISVSGFNCSNGTESSGSAYSHRIQFSGNSGAGVIPIPLLSSFNLTGTTNYFAFKFKGETVSDKLEILFSGANYSQVITLEDIVVGSSLGLNVGNTNYTTFPKSAGTNGYISKVLCLTGFSQTSYDDLILKVTPGNNPQTNWDFYFSCLNTFDCSPSCLVSSPYKIITSALTLSNYGCNNYQVDLKISGCSGVQNLDLYKYYTTDGYFGTYPVSNFFNYNVLLNTGVTVCQTYGTGYGTPSCYNTNGNNIYFSKYINAGIGEIKITGSNLSDLSAYYNSYNGLSGMTGGNPYTSNSNLKDYWKYFQLNVPQTTGAQFCGDGTNPFSYYIHYSSVVTTAQTGSDWEMKVTMPTVDTPHFDCCTYRLDMSIGTSAVTLNYFNCTGGTETLNITLPGTISASTTFESDTTYGSVSFSATGGTQSVTLVECCYLYCRSNVVSIANLINLSSTGTSNNYTGTTTVGSRYTYPMNNLWIFDQVVSVYSSSTLNQIFFQNDYLSKTIPASGSTLTIIPSLSSQTCDFSTYMTYVSNSNKDYWLRYNYYYLLRLIDPTVSSTNFEILASPIGTYGMYSGYPFTIFYENALTYSGGSITYSSSTYCV